MKINRKDKDGFYYYTSGVLLGTIIVMLWMVIYFIFFPYTASQKQSLFSQNFSNAPKSIQIPILIYHYVEFVKDPGDTIRKSLDIIPPIFEAQIATLKDSGYTFLTPADINLILEGKKTLPKKPVIISFDDGYEDFYTDVMPILKKYNVRAVQYVISGLVDTNNYLKSYQIEEIKKTDLVELACHSVNHLALGSLSIEAATSEIEGCKKDMKKKFGVNVISFAFPYGSYDTFLFPILKKAGFKNATTTEAGTEISYENIYNIPRIRGGIRVGHELTSYIEESTTVAKGQEFIKTANAQGIEN